MREIKFRAWDELKKMFIPQEFLTIDCLTGIAWDTERKPNKNLVLMQYTGLHDKNKKEIYESDLVKLMEWEDNPDIYRIHPVTYKVDWWECDAKFHMYSPDYLWGNLPDGKPRQTDQGIEIFRDFNSDEQIIEVIGNIYSNPELLLS